MDIEEYRKKGKEVVDYVAKYLENIRSRRVFPDVSPGYMRAHVAESAPQDGELWQDIFNDVDRVVMPGMTHWQSPHMHAFFPSLNSYPALLGDMITGGLGVNAFTWASSPACTELEAIMTDWLGKMIGLPEEFLHGRQWNIDEVIKRHQEKCVPRKEKDPSASCDCRSWQDDAVDGGKPDTMQGGVLQTTAGESAIVALLAARAEAIERYDKSLPDYNPESPRKNPDGGAYHAKLVAYCSDQAHPCIKKAARVGLVKLRFLPTDENLSLRGNSLKEQMKRDKVDGLVPFFVCATLGTMGTCAFDNLEELGQICTEENLWLHVDAAYAGAAFICEEYRYLMKGVEHAHSFVVNPSQWMMVTFECTAMWVKDSRHLHKALVVDPLYLEHPYSGVAIDYMNWQLGLSKRFRALKLWFVIRAFGVKGLQTHIREGIRRATLFEGLVGRDSRFEVPMKGQMGIVSFRLKGERKLTELLMRRLNASGKLLLDAAIVKNQLVLRFVVTSQHTTEADIEQDWRLIKEAATEVILQHEAEQQRLSTDGRTDSMDMDETKPRSGKRARVADPTSPSKTFQMKERLQNTYGLTHNLHFLLETEVINGSFAAFTHNTEDEGVGLKGLSKYRHATGMNGGRGVNGHTNGGRGINGHTNGGVNGHSEMNGHTPMNGVAESCTKCGDDVPV